MRVTAIKVQSHDKNRVNISIDGKYRFSLHVYQLADLGVKVGKDYEESELQLFDEESQFGKVYGRAVEYCLIRPHSSREVGDYLFRKTLSRIDKSGIKRAGISATITSRVFDRLVEKGYIDDKKFTKYWIENRSLAKGISRRKLTSELISKGVSRSIIDESLSESGRSDLDEIVKIINKKRSRYADDGKLIAYLARLGFGYDTIKRALNSDSQ